KHGVANALRFEIDLCQALADHWRLGVELEGLLVGFNGLVGVLAAAGGLVIFLVEMAHREVVIGLGALLFVRRRGELPRRRVGVLVSRGRRGKSRGGRKPAGKSQTPDWKFHRVTKNSLCYTAPERSKRPPGARFHFRKPPASVRCAKREMWHRPRRIKRILNGGNAELQ